MDPLAPLNIYYYSSVDDQYGRVWSHSFAPLQARKRKELELDDEKKHRKNHLWREWICRNNTPAAHSQQSPSKKKNRNFEKFPVDQSTKMKTTSFFSVLETRASTPSSAQSNLLLAAPSTAEHKRLACNNTTIRIESIFSEKRKNATTTMTMTRPRLRSEVSEKEKNGAHKWQ